MSRRRQTEVTDTTQPEHDDVAANQPGPQVPADAAGDDSATPEEAHATGATTTEVEQEGLEPGEDGELPALSDADQQASIASSQGGPDQYAYVDRTAIPVHERNLSAVNNPLTEASQAELNPAFTAKVDDGGPVVPNPDGDDKPIGTEPNVHEQALAAAENSGEEGAVETVQSQIDAGAEQQMDVDKVNAQAQERAPEGVDASTGQNPNAPK